MGASIRLRDDFDGASLRRLKSANQALRLLALAEIYDGGADRRCWLADCT
jgi:hypothetical protein